jgi:hypothetical protein
MDQNFIRVKDLTLILTVLGLLGTLWKFSGLDDIKRTLNQHTTQIAVMEATLKRIDRNTR